MPTTNQPTTPENSEVVRSAQGSKAMAEHGINEEEAKRLKSNVEMMLAESRQIGNSTDEEHKKSCMSLYGTTKPWGDGEVYDDGADIEYEESMGRADSAPAGVRRMSRL